MCCLSIEFHDEIDERETGLYGGLCFGAGVPVHAHVEVVEQTCAGHPEFSEELFLGGGSEELDSSLQLALRDEVFDGDRSPKAGGPEEVVSAAVAGLAYVDGIFYWTGFL